MSLTEAIFKVQSAVSKVHRDGENPHTKSKYPTLESVLDVLNGPLSDASLVVTQYSAYREYGWVLVTQVALREGSPAFSFDTPLLGLDDSRNKMQALGSAETYARRYALLAFFKLAPTDDDAENSAGLVVVQEKKSMESKNRSKLDLKIADGTYKGKRISEIPSDELLAYIKKIDTACTESGQKPPKWFCDLKSVVGQ